MASENAAASPTAPPPYERQSTPENNATPQQPSPTSTANNPGNSFPQLFQPIAGPVTAQEYSKMVADWQQAYNGWLQASCAHYGALISGAVTAPIQAAFQLNSLAAISSATRHMQHAAEASYSIPSLWRRMGAECIDMVLLFLFRSIITIALYRYNFFDSENRGSIDFSRLLTFLVNDYLADDEDDFLASFGHGGGRAGGDQESLDKTLDDLLAITSNLVVIECIALAFYTLYEVVCLCRPFAGERRIVGGATLGKWLLGLKVVQHDIARMRSGQLGADSIVLHNVQTPTFWRATLRSAIKNFSASVMFPASLTVFFYSHRLAVYDILAATTVVKSASERELPNDHAD